MKLFAVALLFLTSVILIVSLFYIITNTRHKERMALIEKNLDPKTYLINQFMPQTLRAGMLLTGVGFGFLIALLLDEYILTSVDNPAIYAGSILLFGGLGLLLFYKINKKKEEHLNR
ncbi:DUF6249 domain-containing protein [Psychroserpens luteolus]|uniref:DUF6249 domain-containing protein n=1 Tax=Psychroserpens luteolus TaxID=2855840 RepID=UPI001E4468A6|nr:DUF6249 domain-containing protein [Psychroserpens luteolus]MCD2259860.1 hypothetical protein [Psychroserpens luteolus]